MITDLAAIVWKKMPWPLRRLAVRVTQDTFTISVAAVITNPAGEILLLDHRIRPTSGWGFPGGFIEHGEQPEQGLRREIREEVGLEITDVSLIRVRTLGKHIEMLFGAVSDGTAAIKSREIKDFGWFAAASLPEQMSAGQRAYALKVLGVRE